MHVPFVTVPFRSSGEHSVPGYVGTSLIDFRRVETSHSLSSGVVTLRRKKRHVSACFIMLLLTAHHHADLTKYGSHVYVLVRRGELRASKIMAKRLLNNPKVTILWNTVAVECQGDGDLLNNLRIKNVLTGEEKDLPVSGLFYAIGHEPATALVRGQLQTDPEGYIITVPGTTQTSVKGVFAAGDVQDKRYRQAITSAGSGCMAALEAERMIAEEEEGLED